MKYLFSLFLLVSFCQPLYSYSYIDSLDLIVDQKAAVLAKSSYKVDKIVYKIRKNIKTQVSLQEIEEFLENKHSIAFFFCDEVQFKLDEPVSDELEHAQQSFKDLQFALGAKLYLYYLECAKQKMLYKAVKNYDALNYWQNEKFYESQSFFQKNILRSLSGFQYKERIEENIVQLREITQQTNGFLGMIIHSQKLLQNAITRAEFEQTLIDTVRLQDDFLHVPDQCYDNYDMSLIIKKSIDQLSQFSVHVSAQYAQCQLPSHVVRNWKGYSLTAATACAIAFVYFTYGNDIAQGMQHVWDEHLKGSVNNTVNVLSGYTKAPQLDVTKHKERIKELIESGIKKAQARGDEISLHEALVMDCDKISDNEFSEIFQKIDEKMREIDEMSGKIKPIVDEANIWHSRLIEFKKKHPNMRWGDFYKYFKAMSDPVFPDVFQPESRTWARYVTNPAADPTTPIAVEEKVNSDSNSGLPAKPEQESLQESFRTGSGGIGQAIQDKANRLERSAPDSKDWTFEQKRDYYKEQLKIIEDNPYKNILRIKEPVDYTIHEEGEHGKEVINAFAKDIHVILSITALILPVTLLGGSMFASKTLYNSVAYQPIRTLVRRLEIFLNEVFYEPVTFDKEGHLYFLTEQLKLNINVLTIDEQKLITADIEALQTSSLDYVQKTNVVQRMYRTYPCLIPARV